MNALTHTIRTVIALMHREVYKSKELCTQALIDGAFQAAAQYILICYMFPVIGMPPALIAPMYIGAIIAMLFTAGFTTAFNQLFDLKGIRIINYHLTLPISTTWLMIVYVARSMISMGLATIPFFLLALYMVPLFSIPLALKPVSFIVLYSLTLICFAVWYLAASFAYELDWFLTNMWPRRLFFIFLFGCLFIPWSAIYKVSPLVAYIFLCNPMTYIAEGWCATLLPSTTYLPLPLCFFVVMLSIAFGCKALSHCMQKRLDPV